MLRIAQVTLFLAISASLIGQQSASLTATLQQKDQALLDAIAPGQKNVWDAVLSSDFAYVDENNRTLSREIFLKEFIPLPQGVSGEIKIVSYEVHRAGDTAIAIHHDDETEHYFGSTLHAQYLMTEVWQQMQGGWKLRSVHCAAVPVDPLAVFLDDSQLDELTGTFRAGSLTYVIRRDGHRALGGQPGHHEVELQAEARDVLFVPGQPRSRKVFLHDEKGKVTGFADRRENRDLTWSKVPSQ